MKNPFEKLMFFIAGLVLCLAVSALGEQLFVGIQHDCTPRTDVDGGNLVLFSLMLLILSGYVLRMTFAKVRE